MRSCSLGHVAMGAPMTAACAARGLRGRVPPFVQKASLAQSPNQTAALGATQSSTEEVRLARIGL